MRIVRKIRTSTSSSNRIGIRGYRDLSRALAVAPTRASRDELLHLTNMGR